MRDRLRCQRNAWRGNDPLVRAKPREGRCFFAEALRTALRADPMFA
jgi:hypothetical protein